MIQVKLLFKEVDWEKNKSADKTPFDTIYQGEYEYNKPLDMNHEYFPELVDNVIHNLFPKILPKVLKDKQIKKFVPFYKPTITIKNNTLEIGIYHDVNLYFKIYLSAIEQGYVMAPIGELRFKLEALYGNYGFYPEDKVWYPEGTVEDE